MQFPKTPARRGRPRSFDEGLALGRAMTLFWKKGYDAASVDDLAEAMEITPPSLYAAFGNKETLFLRALQYYVDGPTAFAVKALEAATARKAAEQFLYGMVELLSDPENPSGCLATQTVALLADEKTAIGQRILALCNGIHHAYAKRFERAQAEGDLSKDANPDALARYVYTVAQGISVQAAWGANREQLLSVVEIALRQWPS
jgi:AcrR family transcriptional regulator